jgi:hypothetical protein
MSGGQWLVRLVPLHAHRNRIAHNPPGGHMFVRGDASRSNAEITIIEALLLSRNSDQGKPHSVQYTPKFIAERAHEAASFARPLHAVLGSIAQCPMKRER